MAERVPERALMTQEGTDRDVLADAEAGKGLHDLEGAGNALRWRARWVGNAVISRPSKATEPEVAASNPAMTVNNVVLPAPLGPISPVIEPLATSIEASSTAVEAAEALGDGIDD
jgi:hypothetical protein